MANVPGVMMETDPDSDDVDDLHEGGVVSVPEPIGPARRIPEPEYVILDDEGPANRESAVEDSGETLLEERSREAREPRNVRRQRQKVGRDKSQAELEFLRSRVDELEGAFQNVAPRFAQIDVDRHKQTLDQIGRKLDEQVAAGVAARKEIAAAMAIGDSDGVIAALEKRDQALLSGTQLSAQKQHLERILSQQVAPQEQSGRPAAPPPLPTQVKAKVQNFMAEHPWYNPKNSRDTDSKIVLQLDQSVVEDGFDPKTDEYWDELEDRVRQYLPHKFEEPEPRKQEPPRRQQAPAPQRRGPSTAAPSDRPSGAPPGRNEVRLSPGRKEALINAGILERDGRTVANKEKFARVMKRYQEHDRDSGGRG